MSTDPETTRIVRSWLMTDEHESATHIVEVALAEIDAIPQRPSTPWPARRTPTMNKILGFGLAAAAVVAVLIVGAQLFGSPGGLGAGPTTTPSPTASPDPSESEPSPSAAADLEGPFVLGDGLPITVTIAAPGWSAIDEAFPAKNGNMSPPDGAVMIGPWHGFDLYIPTDPCGWRSTWPDAPATSLEEIVAALAGQASRDASEPVDVSVDGHPGKSITLHVPDDVGFSGGEFDCDEGKFCTFGDAADCQMWHNQAPSAIDELWIVDLDGEIVAVTGAYYPETPAEDVDELQTILGSMTFGE